MKVLVAICLLLGAFAASSAGSEDALQCEHRKPNVPQEWIDMVSPCVQEMRRQIGEELKASLKYLAMGAHFSKDVINRPGFAKMFFESASEERQHAIKLISYLLMRGELTSKVSELINKNIDVDKSSWESGVAALEDALRLEAYVTKSIKRVIKVCEEANDSNDYHLVDYLTGDFLDEQYKGQRDLAGKISTLDKLRDNHGALGEFLFDKKLLGGEL